MGRSVEEEEPVVAARPAIAAIVVVVVGDHSQHPRCLAKGDAMREGGAAATPQACSGSEA